MKTLLALCVCGLAIATYAQTPPKNFRSLDGIFQFKYSAELVDCSKKTMQPSPAPARTAKTSSGEQTTPQPPDSCLSQAGVCDDGGNQAHTLACFAYPKDRFKDKPEFIAAAFFVAEIKEATTEEACLQASQYWYTTGESTAKLNNVNFKVFEIEDNWAGGGQSGPIYRTFRNGKCYELGIQTAMSRAAYEPGTTKKFTKQDDDEVQRSLKKAFDSFTFLK